jgi:stearoyl-CoA desaturase (delta-9 desaturase)
LPTSELLSPSEAIAELPPRLTAEDQPKSATDRADKIATAVVTIIPLLALAVGVVLAWGGDLHWYDAVVFVVCYIPPGLGITIGYHRLLTHRAFVAKPAVRAVFTVLGCTAIQGPPIEWVANHRKHHVYSDEPGDPHSPHVDHGSGWRGALHGLAHAHLGWLFRSPFANQRRYAPDLIDDPVVRWIDATFLLWVVVSFAVPFGLGYAITASLTGALTCLLWAGAVRVMLLHHVTFSINSLCHFFGRQDFETGDQSRNLAWLAPLSFGEAWHNNHHAFPRSAAHGLTWRQFDSSALVIRGLERLGLVDDLVVVSSDRQAQKRR